MGLAVLVLGFKAGRGSADLRSGGDGGEERSGQNGDAKKRAHLYPVYKRGGGRLREMGPVLRVELRGFVKDF